MVVVWAWLSYLLVVCRVALQAAVGHDGACLPGSVAVGASDYRCLLYHALTLCLYHSLTSRCLLSLSLSFSLPLSLSLSLSLPLLPHSLSPPPPSFSLWSCRHRPVAGCHARWKHSRRTEPPDSLSTRECQWRGISPTNQ